MIRRPPRSTLFPTRRSSDLLARLVDHFPLARDQRILRIEERRQDFVLHADQFQRPLRRLLIDRGQCRSEEHTSELQSQSNLVCRLLLEKKKTNKKYSITMI